MGNLGKVSNLAAWQLGNLEAYNIQDENATCNMQLAIYKGDAFKMTTNNTTPVQPQGEFRSANQNTMYKEANMNQNPLGNNGGNRGAGANPTGQRYAPPPPPPRAAPPMMRPQTKSGFLTFVFACVPGAGQMYQGLFKKGGSLMAAFFLLLGFSSWAFVPPLMFLLPVVWFYAFFDTINRMRMTLPELALVQDDYILFSNSEQNSKLSKEFNKRHKLFGWLLVGTGVYIIFDMLSGVLMDMIEYSWVREVIWNIRRIFPALAIAVACVGIGLYLIRGSLKDKNVVLNTNLST